MHLTPQPSTAASYMTSSESPHPTSTPCTLIVPLSPHQIADSTLQVFYVHDLIERKDAAAPAVPAAPAAGPAGLSSFQWRPGGSREFLTLSTEGELRVC